MANINCMAGLAEDSHVTQEYLMQALEKAGVSKRS
jgi:hypothetical protein